MGKSNRNIIYSCSQCKREVGRDNLRAKTVAFKDMGQGGRTIQTRVVAWLCIIDQADGSPSCCELDPAWNAARYTGSPGLADVVAADAATAPADGPVDVPGPQVPAPPVVAVGGNVGEQP